MEGKLSSPVDLLRESWDVFTSRLRTLAVIQLVPTLILFPIILLGVSGALLSAFWGQGQSTSNFGSLYILSIPLLIIAIAGAVLGFWSQVALLFAIKDNQEQIGFKEAYKRGWGKLRSYLWVTLLAGLAILGGFLLFIIPGIIFAVWFSLVGFVVVSEELRGRAALRRSKELVKGRWWGVFGRFLFLGLVALVLLIALSSIEFLWAKVGLSWVGQIISNIVWFLWALFAIIYSYLLYYHLRVLKGSA